MLDTTRGARMAADEESACAPGVALPLADTARPRATICIPLANPVLDPRGAWRWYPPEEADLSLLQTGLAPLLLDHAHSADSVIGQIETAWIENGNLLALVRASLARRHAEVWNDIAAGILPHVSMGAIFTPAHAEGGGFMCQGWRPYEISVVAVPGHWHARISHGAPAAWVDRACEAVIRKAAGTPEGWRAWAQRIAAELHDERVATAMEAELARLGEAEAARLR
jgi:hypothetical protein